MQDLTVQQFVEQYEVPRVPVVVTGLTDAWPAAQQWTPGKLLEQFREHRFKVSEGECVRQQLVLLVLQQGKYPLLWVAATGAAMMVSRRRSTEHWPLRQPCRPPL